ncbi:exo-beta-N-acetylmuramidase NamZ domain-containing protein [Mucilaginibacter humi]|uniref:exo-beta-N-acetylmuramidase NamZ domain-containing protein n=1 Tax=Mucilaginibacter humi TaxID=2732510 RepID=UPI00293BA1A5|nr:exo-beta-N-acetylmuramidase NamZ domain-containing protein [Mucilaginibacter humi]
MEACAENNIELLILDRPNPNGTIIDGPVLDTNYKSFVGMHPIPIAHGMTIAEYAQMINGEGWLKNRYSAS